TRALLDAIVAGIDEVKGREARVLDLRKIAVAPADYYVVCTGTSSTHVSAIADSIERETEKLTGESPRHTEGKRVAQWVLLDYFNVLVHIFDESTRKHFALEELWADAKEVKLKTATAKA
ncbi:MAG: ribosome silencing factor, partial [Flavobacteriales bacterium]|nr:ribosome silencing factor [Flavobacteriales bacterium]